jgi:hypothetical protein
VGLDYLVRRAHQVEVRAAADVSDLCAGLLGQLHGEGADAARGSVDQHLLAGPDV